MLYIPVDKPCEQCELCGRETLKLTPITEEGATWNVCVYCHVVHEENEQ